MARKTKKFVNRRGWWGIMIHASWATGIAILLTTIVAWLISDTDAARSAFWAGGVVWALSAVTIAGIAVVWDRARQWAMMLALAAFVVKIVLAGILLAVIPAPAWLDGTAAALSAVISIVVWQFVELYVFAKTRQSIGG